EDTVTFVDEPDHLPSHLANLEVLRSLGAERILPNHGSPAVIESEGYTTGLILATEDYIRTLQRVVDEPSLRDAPRRDLIAGALEAGGVPALPPLPARRPPH